MCLSVCVCVCVTEVGCSWGGTRLVMCDLRTTKPRTPRRERWAWASWKLLEQLTVAISVSSSQSGRNRGAAGEAAAAVKADAIGELHAGEAGAAVEVDAIEEQQPKQTQSGSS